MARRSPRADKQVQDAARNLTAALLATSLEVASAQAVEYVVDVSGRRNMLATLDQMRELVRALFPDAIDERAVAISRLI